MLSLQQEMNDLVGCWISCHAFKKTNIPLLMIICVFLILWIINLKLSKLICCVADHSGSFLFSRGASPVCTVTYSGKMALSI